MARVVDIFPAGGPVAPHLVIGRRGDIEDLAFKVREGISVALAGPTRVGKTTLGDAVCAEAHGKLTVLPCVEVAEHRADASDLLRAIVAACEQATLADEAKKIARALRPAFETLLRGLGLSTDLKGLFAEPESLSQRQVLLLPLALALAQAAGRPVVLFLDELQRVYEFEDHGLQFLADLVDLYTGHREVVVLVDGSEERLLAELFAQAQLGKLLDRHDIAPRILKSEWRAALPDRFAPGRRGDRRLSPRDTHRLRRGAPLRDDVGLPARRALSCAVPHRRTHRLRR